MAFLRRFWRSRVPAIGLIALSYVVVAFGQPAWSAILGLFAATCGYTLFWRATFYFRHSVTRFLLSALWYAAVQLFQLSWMTADDYQGRYIWLVWLLLALVGGAQFGLLSLFVRPLRKMTLLRVLGVPAIWVLMEWSRLFIAAGNTWNPAGLALTGFTISAQLVAVAGVYGLSFWVMLVNTLVLQLWVAPHRSRRWILAAAAGALPYVFGGLHLWFHQTRIDRNPADPLAAVLVQTGLGPLEKGSLGLAHPDALPLSLQWRRIIDMLSDFQEKRIDLILMPEGALPLDHAQPIWGRGVNALIREYGQPATAAPEQTICNADLCRALSDHLATDLIIGLIVRQEEQIYNAALHFQPGKEEVEQYAKRVLFPFAEAMPYQWMESIGARYGITASFTPGDRPGLFSSPVPVGVTICYEETFSELVRQCRNEGAEVLVNLTADGWFPNSRLPLQHFTHGRLRALENGLPLLRACHTGVTAAIDSLGRTVDLIGDRRGQPFWLAKALYVEVPRYHYRTLYSYVGDGMIVGISMLCALLLIYNPSSRVTTLF
jgi:apolipoprotein N-acyltransferase